MDEELIDRYSEALKAEGYSYRSRIGHRHCLRQLLRWMSAKRLAIDQVTLPLLHDYLRSYRRSHHHDLHSLIWSLKRFFRYAAQQGLIAQNPADGISLHWLKVPGGFPAYQGVLRKLRRRAAEIFKYRLPLFAPWWEVHLQQLLDRGYTPASVRRLLLPHALFHRYVIRKQIRSLLQIRPAHVTAFLEEHHARFRRNHDRVPDRSYQQHLRRALFRFLTFAFREQHRSFQKPKAHPDSRILPNALLNRFQRFCREHKGVKEITLSAWTRDLLHLRLFLDRRRIRALRQVSINDMDAFFIDQSHHMTPRALAPCVTAARVFFRFLYLQGDIPSDLARHFTSPCRFKADRRPKYLPWTKIQQLLATIDRHHPKGIRDYAVLCLLCYHGLRPSEVTRLTLQDIDWNDSSMLLRERKNGVSARLPLSSPVKEALQKYVAIRPTSRIPNLFLSHRAPLRPLAVSSIGSFVPRYLRHCFGDSLDRYNPYLFRHSFAKALLDRGAPLSHVGALLGHRHIDSTLIYTRIHTRELREASDNYADLL